MKSFVREYDKVNIEGKDYDVRELSLAEKNKLLENLKPLIRSLATNAFFKKDGEGHINFVWIDEVSFADLNIDEIILSSVDILPELLKLAVPGFKDWDNLPESESRSVSVKAVALQDFKGYIAHFFSLGTAIIR